MRKIIKGPKITWIDIQPPTKDDINFLKKHYRFHPLVLGELIPPTYRPLVEHHSKYLFMALHYPVYDKEKRETTSRELNIIVTKDTIVTSHHKTILPLKRLFIKCNLSSKLRDFYLGKESGYLLFYILDSFWSHCLTKLERINNGIEKIEGEIFKEKEREMVREISYIKTDIISFWRIIEPQEEILKSLLKEGVSFFGKETEPYFLDLLGTFTKVWNSLGTYKETILALENTNQSLLSTKTNEIIKILTVFSVIMLPLTLFASIWGMNFMNLPLAESKIGFWVIILIMFTTLGLMFYYFRRKKWL